LTDTEFTLVNPIGNYLACGARFETVPDEVCALNHFILFIIIFQDHQSIAKFASPSSNDLRKRSFRGVSIFSQIAECQSIESEFFNLISAHSNQI
jgi:hypothetical protein